MFPKLKIISCWADGSAGQDAAELNKLFPTVYMQPKGLLATEYFASFPLVGEDGGRLCVNSHFFEFRRADGKIYTADRLERGEYELIVTTGGGLYRYMTGDVIEVLETYPAESPRIRFLRRSGVTSDLCGEKLTDDFVRSACEKLGIAGSFCLLAPEGKGYVLYTSDRSVTDEIFDRALRESYHYNYCRELLNKKRYITINTVEAIRGCCHRCSFCAYPAAFGHPVYKRPVKEVIAEIEALHSRHVLFPDVNLIADRAYAIELFSAMIPLKVMWLGLVTSAVGIDDELITVFRKSGCKGLLIGFESITQESQTYIHKGVNRVDGYIVLMKRLHDNGIMVQGCFAFGGDEEDTSVFERTVETVIKAKIDLPRYSILTPFPRTELYAQLEREGRITERNWAMYDVQHCVFKPKKMTKEQLEEGTDLAWRLTYSTGNIMKRLMPLRHSPWLSVPLNLGYKGYADKWHKFTREVMCDNSDIPGETES